MFVIGQGRWFSLTKERFTTGNLSVRKEKKRKKKRKKGKTKESRS